MHTDLNRIDFVKRLYFFLLVSILVFSSCATTTKDFLSPVAYDDSLSIKEKLEYFGAMEVSATLMGQSGLKL